MIISGCMQHLLNHLYMLEVHRLHIRNCTKWISSLLQCTVLHKKNPGVSKCKHRSLVGLAIEGHALSVCLLPLLKCSRDSTYLEIEIGEGGQWCGKGTCATFETKFADYANMHNMHSLHE